MTVSVYLYMIYRSPRFVHNSNIYQRTVTKLHAMLRWIVYFTITVICAIVVTVHRGLSHCRKV